MTFDNLKQFIYDNVGTEKGNIILGAVKKHLKTTTMTQLATGLNKDAETIFNNNKEKGFWDKERNIGELLMLVVSELSEALEAHRKDNYADTEYYDELLAEGCTWEKNKSTFKSCFETHIKDTFEDEIADAVIRLLDLCGHIGIDLEKHINAKVAYNKTRERLHGKKY